MNKTFVFPIISILMILSVCQTRTTGQNLVWYDAFGGDNIDHPAGISVDHNYNTYITGTFYSTVFSAPPLSIPKGPNNIFFLLKLDPSGTPELLIRPNRGDFYGADVQADSKENIFLLAVYTSSARLLHNQDLPFPGDGGRGIMVKYDNAGNVQWYHTMLNEDWVGIRVGMAIVGDNHMVLAGSGRDTIYGYQSDTSYSMQLNVRCLDSTGVVKWYHSFHASDQSHWKRINFRSVKRGLDDKIYISGYKHTDTLLLNGTYFAASPYNNFVICLDTSGNVVSHLFVPSADDFEVTAIAADQAGNMYAYGFFNAPVFALPGLPPQQNSDIVNPRKELFLAKFDPSGNPLWIRSIKSTMSKTGNRILLDIAGNIYINGSFLGPILELDDITMIGNLSQGSNGFILKYDASGNRLYHMRSANHAGAFFNVALAGPDDFVVVGEISPGEMLFGSGSLNSYGGIFDVFAARISMTTDMQKPERDEMDLRIYPNPVKDNLFIEYDNHIPDSPLLIRITDMRGREVERRHIMASEQSVIIPCGHLQGGMYLLHVSDHRIHRVEKFIKTK